MTLNRLWRWRYRGAQPQLARHLGSVAIGRPGHSGNSRINADWKLTRPGSRPRVSPPAARESCLWKTHWGAPRCPWWERDTDDRAARDSPVPRFKSVSGRVAAWTEARAADPRAAIAQPIYQAAMICDFI